LDHLAVVLGPDAKIIVFYRPTLSRDTPVDAAADLLQTLGGAAPQQLQKLDVAFAGGSKKLQLEQRMKAARLRLQAGGAAGALGALQLIPLLARVSKLNWLGSELQDSRVNVFPCTSLTLTYRT
jgi:hypothetical protein